MLFHQPNRGFVSFWPIVLRKSGRAGYPLKSHNIDISILVNLSGHSAAVGAKLASIRGHVGRLKTPYRWRTQQRRDFNLCQVGLVAEETGARDLPAKCLLPAKPGKSNQLSFLAGLRCPVNPPPKSEPPGADFLSVPRSGRLTLVLRSPEKTPQTLGGFSFSESRQPILISGPYLYLYLYLYRYRNRYRNRLSCFSSLVVRPQALGVISNLNRISVLNVIGPRPDFL